MRLMPIFFLLVVAPAAWAQQSRPANAPEQGPPSLSRSSFSARELHNERVLTDFFVGDFADIPSSFDREKVFFMALFRQYLEAYGRQCDAFLPANKVELTRTVCAREQYSVNRFGQRVGMSSCVEYRTEGIGVYADPTLNAAISKLGNDQQGSLLKDSVLKMGDQNAVNDLQQLPDDMNALLRRNACASPGLKRFQENLVLFSMGKPPIPLSGVAPAATSPLAPFKDQNYMRLLEDLIAEQGKTWMLNRFVRGSTSDVVVSRDAAGRPSKIVAKYLFNPVPGRPDRSQGSVAVDFSDGAPSCMYFFDSPSSCKTPDRRIAAAYSSGGYQQLEPATVQPGGARAANPARVPLPSQPSQPAPDRGAPAQPVPPAAPVAPPLTAEQQRAQQAAEIQKRAAKFTACREREAQALKDRPEDAGNIVKEYAACIQAK